MSTQKKKEKKRKFALWIRPSVLELKLISDFPESAQMFEYHDFLRENTRASAADFVGRALEDYAQENMSPKTYADYITTRPRAERVGSHGLFTDDGVEVSLSKEYSGCFKLYYNCWIFK